MVAHLSASANAYETITMGASWGGGEEKAQEGRADPCPRGGVDNSGFTASLFAMARFIFLLVELWRFSAVFVGREVNVACAPAFRPRLVVYSL